MSWPEVSRMESRLEFIRLASAEGANVSALCRRFAVSRKTGHKWLARHRAGGGAADQPRRPASSPGRTLAAVEAAVLALRAEHPSWGGRKLRRRLLDLAGGKDRDGAQQDGAQRDVPAASTVTAILARNGCLGLGGAAAPATGRFEHDRPNALWQMDFKGHFALPASAPANAPAALRCHPLTLLDDHSRYAVCLHACADEGTGTVRDRLVAVFRRYGLPERMNMDNGSPWGSGPGQPWTPLTVWLTRLGVGISHSRPYHPQTNGKAERFHRTLKRDVLFGRSFDGLPACQAAFDDFRETYNAHRPHEALGLAVPASRYQASPRNYPEALAPVEYDPADQVRRVQQGGWVSFRGHDLRLPHALAGQHVALRPTTTDGLWTAVFIRHTLAQLDLRNTAPTQKPVTYVPEHV